MGNNHPEVVQAHIDQLHSPESSEYQQYLRCWVGDQHLEEMDKGALEPINDQVSYLENYVTKRLRHNHSNLLKQTSSWPKLVLSDMTEHSEANLPWSMTDLTEACGFDDGSNLEEDESLEDLENQSLNFWIKARLCLVQFWYCFSANEKYKQEMRRRRSHGKGLPAVNSVSKIDKVSRIMFPLIFFILNVIYWSFYIRERSIEFNQEDMADINLS